MAYKNLTKMAANGVFNLYETEGGNYVLCFVTSDKRYVLSLERTAKAYIAYLTPSASSDDYLDLNDYFLTGFTKMYPDIGKRKYTVLQKAHTPKDIIIQGYVGNSGAKAPQKILKEMLVSAGYDVTKLDAKITSTAERDYSELMQTPQAIQAYDTIATKLKLLGASMTASPPEVKTAYETIRQGKISSVFFIGPAGTGKSVMSYILSNAMKAPLLIYQATSGMVVEDMKGQFIPSETPGKQFEFCMGLLLKAYTEGWQMVIDEINMAPADVLSVLNQFMDDTPSITINDVIYTRHPNFVLYLTMNAGYEGTFTLNPALKSRGLKIIIGALDEKTFKQRMLNYSNNVCGSALTDKFLTVLYGFQNYVQALSSGYAEVVDICIRNGQQLAAQILSKVCTMNEFEEAVHSAYTNNLTMDNDNYSEIQSLKKTVEMQEKIKELYSHYTFKKLSEVAEESLLVYDDCVDTDFPSDDTDEDDITSSEIDVLSKELGEDAADILKELTEDSEPEEEPVVEEEAEDLEDKA